MPSQKPKRDNFPERVKRAVVARVVNRCSNPQCRKNTSGPQADPTGVVNVGVAAHITAASPGGSRYDPSLTPQERRHHSNAIWLCQICAKHVDDDPIFFTAFRLRKWKQKAEEEARSRIGRAVDEVFPTSLMPVSPPRQPEKRSTSSSLERLKPG